MTEEELEVLLYRGESDEIDYKSKQYRFVGAPDAEKAELLKDCLAFANSWRKGQGHILIGVTEHAGQPAQVTGISPSDHIDDAKLQQFVNQKTNCPIRFSYSVIQYQGMGVGILIFDKDQERPVSLKKDFAHLKKDTVYIRRGSSTDICKPSEIARMGESHLASRQLNFDFHFAPSKRVSVKDRIAKVAVPVFIRPEWVDRREPGSTGSAARFRPVVPPWMSRDRTPAEKFDEVQDIARFVELVFGITNSGKVTAEDIQISIDIPICDGLSFCDLWNPPEKDYKNPLRGIGGVSIHTDSSVTDMPDKWSVHLSCKSLHAKKTYKFDPIYITSDRLVEIKCEAILYARDLPDPMVFPLEIRVDTVESQYSADLWDQYDL